MSRTKIITRENIDNMHKFMRINLINSLSGYKSANLIGTISSNGEENVAIFSSVVHLGSNPPLFGFILRPNVVPRNTYENLKENGYYTINHVAQSFIEEAHHTSAKYAKDISEFDMTALSQIYINDFKAPFVEESPIKIGMQYLEEYEIKANNTIMVVGEVCFVSIDEEYITKDGFVNLSEAGVAAINGLDGYAIPKLKTRFEYQRPKTTTTNGKDGKYAKEGTLTN